MHTANDMPRHYISVLLDGLLGWIEHCPWDVSVVRGSKTSNRDASCGLHLSLTCNLIYLAHSKKVILLENYS